MDSKEFNDRISEFVDGDEELKADFASIFGVLVSGVSVSCDSLPDVCPICGSPDNIAKRRRNTSYMDDEFNWFISCVDCFERD